jgi:predicted peptidase
MRPVTLTFAVLLTSLTLLPAQQFAPPKPNVPDEATLKAIAAKTEKLEKAIADLKKNEANKDADIAEVEIYHKAAVWIVRHNEFYSKDSGAWTLEVLDDGLKRAEQLAAGKKPWQSLPGKDVARAYRSRVDGSVQPYAVSLPADYGKDPEKKWRLDIVLHGRDSSISEVKFLRQHNGTKDTPKDQDFVKIDIFGRGNNAYRWAGDTDVGEAIGKFLRSADDREQPAIEEIRNHPHIDIKRVVIRGFSMGGAGTWHIGLHRPTLWAVMGPGAGFTTTHGYIKGLPEKLPAYQEACLHIYDAVDYAENAANIPVVAYSGEKDAQKAAADNIEAILKAKQIPMTHLIGPGLEHQFPPEWQKKAEAEYAKYATKGRNEYPDKVHFVTYTLKYHICAWVSIRALDHHYERSVVDAERTKEGFKVKTTNVRILSLRVPKDTKEEQVVHIDGQAIQAEPGKSRIAGGAVYLEKKNGKWEARTFAQLKEEAKGQLQKNTTLHGPIDDAFMGPFLCVRGTGKPWHEATQEYADANLDRFAREWNQYMRGNLPIKDDKDVTEEDMRRKHLILFGDPASNSLIEKFVKDLPVKWTKESVGLAGKDGDAAAHIPVLIYPNPLTRDAATAAQRYIVLNSGHTFHAADFHGTNALLYPRLGDFALLKLNPTEKARFNTEVVTAGLFDEEWKVPAEKK